MRKKRNVKEIDATTVGSNKKRKLLPQNLNTKNKETDNNLKTNIKTKIARAKVLNSTSNKSTPSPLHVKLRSQGKCSLLEQHENQILKIKRNQKAKTNTSSNQKLKNISSIRKHKNVSCKLVKSTVNTSEKNNTKISLHIKKHLDKSSQLSSEKGLLTLRKIKPENMEKIKTNKTCLNLPNPKLDKISNKKPDKKPILSSHLSKNNENNPETSKMSSFHVKKPLNESLSPVSFHSKNLGNLQKNHLIKSPKLSKSCRKSLFNPKPNKTEFLNILAADKSFFKEKTNHSNNKISSQKHSNADFVKSQIMNDSLQKLSHASFSSNHKISTPKSLPSTPKCNKLNPKSLSHEKSSSYNKTPEMTKRSKCNILKSIKRKYSPNLKKILFNPALLESPSSSKKNRVKPKLFIDFSDDDDESCFTPHNTSKGKKSLFTPFSVDSPNSSLEMSQNNDRIEKRKRHKSQIANIKRSSIFSHSAPVRKLRCTTKRSDNLNISDTKLSELYCTSLQMTSECSGVTNAFIDLFTYIKQNPDQVDKAKNIIDTKVNSSCLIKKDIANKPETSPKQKKLSNMIETDIKKLTLDSKSNFSTIENLENDKLINVETNNDVTNITSESLHPPSIVSLIPEVYGKVCPNHASNSLLNQSLHDDTLFMPLDYDFRPCRKMVADTKLVKVNPLKVQDISQKFKNSSSLESLNNFTCSSPLEIRETPLNKLISGRKKKK